MLRAVCCFSIALLVTIAACSSDDEGGPVTPGIAKPTGHPAITVDELEAQFLEGVEDESVPMTEADLDKYFPVVAPLTEPEKWAVEGDPTKGEEFEVNKAFDAFVGPEAVADDHCTVEVGAGVKAEDVTRAKKGILFGMARWDALKPGFSVMAATKKSAGGIPFKLTLTTAATENLSFRPFVEPCGGANPAPVGIPQVVASVDANTCIPRLVMPIAEGKSKESLSPFLFVHEMAHIAQNYWTRSAAYLGAGGLKQAAAYSQELGWAFEADAQFTARHSPEDFAYDTYLARGCPFEPLRRGAYAWRSFVGSSGPVEQQILSYQMGIFVDQLTFHRFGKDPAWTYKWLTADPDPRSPKTPITPTRKLFRLLSKDGTATDMKSINGALLRAGFDLYVRGRVPWTTRQLNNDCIRPGGTVNLPLLAFDAVRVELPDLANVAKLRLSLDASRDRDFIRAGVAAVKLDSGGLPEFVRCAQGTTDGNLSNADPRGGCMQELIPLSVLSPKNNFVDEVQLPITMQAGGKYAIVAIVAHRMNRKDAPDTPITVTVRAEPVSTPPGKQIAKDQCGKLTEQYRSQCKTSDCGCIGNAYCEATVDPPPASCEKMQQECYIFCLFQKDECDCSSFCDLLYSRLECGTRSP